MKLILLSVATIAFATSCNTMIGVGRDTRVLGETLEKAAQKVAPGDGSKYETDTGTTDTTGIPDTTGYEADPSADFPVY